MVKYFIFISILFSVSSQESLSVLNTNLAVDSSAVKLEYEYKQFLDSVKVAYQNYVIRKPQLNLTYQSVFRFQPMMINRYSALESHTVPREFLLGEDAISGVYSRNFVGINLLAIIPLTLHWANIRLPAFGGYVDQYTLELIEEAAWQNQMQREIAKRDF